MEKVTNCPLCGKETKEITLQDGRKGYVCPDSKKMPDGTRTGCQWTGAWEKKTGASWEPLVKEGVNPVCPKCGAKILTKTTLKGEASSFVLELPPYRKPKFLKIIWQAVKEKILLVLFRAVIVAAPAGVVIWVLANTYHGDISYLNIVADFLDPVGRFLGLDGVILLGFILGFPANEIVIPIILMTYLSTGEITDYSSLDSLRQILVDNGWTVVTALCTCIFSMFHFPCSTTLLTIWQETKSVKWTLMSIAVPLAVGMVLCALINLVF